MSSQELKSIFERAAALVELRLASEPGVGRILTDLAQRVPNVGEDPRFKRGLFFEPRIDSQQLGVPRLTAEKVAVLLHRFGIFHIWARISCPDVGVDDVGTIIESDREDEVRAALDHSCDHCGMIHEVSDADCESVYAFVSTPSCDPADFDFSSLAISNVEQVLNNGAGNDSGRLALLAPKSQEDGQFQILLLQALAANTAPKEIPAPRDAYFNAWKGPLCLLGLYAPGICLVGLCLGQAAVWLASVVFLVMGWLTLRATVQARLAPSAVQRSVIWLGVSGGVACFAYGASGLSLSASVSEGAPWFSRLEFGETSIPLLTVGVVIIAMTLLFVLVYDGKIGWLR